MNRYLILILFAASLSIVTACNSPAQVQWKNSSAANVSEIRWEIQSSTEVTWNGTLADGATNEFKSVTKLSGNGACLDAGGTPRQIILSDGSISKTLTEGTSETLVIQSTQ